jgi:hypothetical protein
MALQSLSCRGIYCGIGSAKLGRNFGVAFGKAAQKVWIASWNFGTNSAFFL